ncbi:glycosyltransferase family 2 protein [Crateriforma spongiae]|uniref:glycosyltransferase family 2 protein n=1 Tax=Crateriforma spongiae TaxID=2724528 RepID=UPI001445099B|nr:glycosyltransferase family 2 protein [Crateriforma spongiae]
MRPPVKFECITAVFNRASTVTDCLNSIAEQTLEFSTSLVVDGMSTDGTEAVIAEHRGPTTTVIREPDDGIYDALNKGIRYATGDVIGFLHADDMLADADCLAAVAEAFEDPDADAVFGDLVYVDSVDTNRIIRYWREKPFDRRRFRTGWMPPHPTVYIRREIYERYGGFRDDLRTSADYELMVRLFYKHQVRLKHIPKILVKMRMGGQSNASWSNRRLANREDRMAWIVNDLKPPPFLRLTKPMRKLPQYWLRPSEPLPNFP